MVETTAQFEWASIITIGVMLLIGGFILYDFYKLGGFNPDIRKRTPRIGADGLLTFDHDIDTCDD